MPTAVVTVAALVVLLVVAFRHTPAWIEAGAGLIAALACVPTAATSWHQAYDAGLQILPVVVFLVAILAVSGGCADLGLFRALGERIGRGGTGPQRFLLLTFAVAVVVTAVLSLDATVVLLTPVVLAAALSAGVVARPALSACVRLANSSSLLLPVSNLTTLLAIRSLDLSFTRFALVMAPAWLGVIGVEYVAHRRLFRGDLVGPPTDDRQDPGPRVLSPLPRFPLVVLVLMLVGFVVASASGLGAAWGSAVVAVVAALVLLLAVGVRREPDAPRRFRRVLATAQPSFAVYVLGLAVVVDAVARGGLGDLVGRLIPGHPSSLTALIWLAVLATVLANVVNNLPATLLLLPLVTPLGTLPVLATLVGLNVGSSLTWTGSLANLLWRRTLTTAGARASARDFHRVSVLTVPVAVVLGVLLTWAWGGLIL